jgi:hypothetical protein
MKCVFDHYALLFMLEQFPRSIATDLWKLFDEWCNDDTIISQREARKRFENEAVESESLKWCKVNSAMFKPINENEAIILGEMMKKREFDFFNDPRLAERRMPEAIPFILCIAKNQDRYFVYRKNTNTDYFNKIKKICTAYKINHIEVEDCLLKLNEESKARGKK